MIGTYCHDTSTEDTILDILDSESVPGSESGSSSDSGSDTDFDSGSDSDSDSEVDSGYVSGGDDPENTGDF